MVATLYQPSLRRRGKNLSKHVCPAPKWLPVHARPLTLREQGCSYEDERTLGHRVTASVSLHSLHNALAAIDASHPTPTISLSPHQHAPHVHAQAQVHVKPIELCLLIVFQLELGRIGQLKFRENLNGSQRKHTFSYTLTSAQIETSPHLNPA